MSSLLRVHLALLPVRISSLMVTIITTVAFEEWGGLYAFPSTEDQHLPIPTTPYPSIRQFIQNPTNPSHHGS